MLLYCSHPQEIHPGYRFSYDLLHNVVKDEFITYFEPDYSIWKDNALIHDPVRYKEAHILILEVV